MARVRHYDYNQTVIGDCGHACSVWPQVGPLGGSGPVEVICDVCTRDKYGVNADYELACYVRVKETLTPIKKPPAKKRGVKTVKCRLCSKTGHTMATCPLVAGQGVLDGT